MGLPSFDPSGAPDLTSDHFSEKGSSRARATGLLVLGLLFLLLAGGWLRVRASGWAAGSGVLWRARLEVPLRLLLERVLWSVRNATKPRARRKCWRTMRVNPCRIPAFYGRLHRRQGHHVQLLV